MPWITCLECVVVVVDVEVVVIAFEDDIMPWITCYGYLVVVTVDMMVMMMVMVMRR